MDNDSSLILNGEYRPLNYWGWLENITPEEVRWQISQMHAAGLGGYVMHARGGLDIPYMGQQWLDSVSAMIDEGKRLGMSTIVDDEDGWPSGFGAGEVNGKGEDYWLKWLQFERVGLSELKTSHETIAVYAQESGGKYRRIDPARETDCGQSVLHIYYKSNRYYVDNLDPKVVGEFIKASHEKYFTKYPEEFGCGIKSIFSDEPQLARQFFPWSFVLCQEHGKRFGNDLLDILPALFFRCEGYERARYEYWSSVNSLFANSYAKQVGEWCGAHGIVLSGHTVCEEQFGLQTLGSGGTMTFYEHMQLPGIDWLCRIGVSNMLVKQVTSVSEQLGKERTLSEMFGCAGWNVSFEELKWIGEWHYVLGVNLMLQHLGLYSLRGSRKREYPASLFYQQPWWGDYKAFNDYFASLSEIMAQSEVEIDLLVLHPLKSAWISFDGEDHDKIGWENHWIIEGNIVNPATEYYKQLKELDADFKYLTDSLLELNYDFHYGDETLMARHGGVEGNRITVGKCSYGTVIIPPCLSLDKSTVDLLIRFAEGGGHIISAGAFPMLTEGVDDGLTQKLRGYISQIPNEKSALDAALSHTLARPVSVTLKDGGENKHIYCRAMKRGQEYYYYIVNTDIQNKYEFNIRLDREGEVLALDALSGTPSRVSTDSVSLEPAQSLLLVQGREADDVQPALYYGEASEVLSIPTDSEWDICERDLNSLTLDCCEYSIDGGDWQSAIPVITLQQKLVGLGRAAHVDMRFTFLAGEEIASQLYLVLEQPELFKIMLNEEAVSPADCGWWVDKAFRKLDITGRCKKGRNELVLSRRFYCSPKVYEVLGSTGVHEAEINRLRYDTELESVYLLGDFAVKTDGKGRAVDKRAMMYGGGFTITPMANRVSPDNLVEGGFPFFTGSVSLSRRVELRSPHAEQRLVLRLCRPDSIVTEVILNGTPLRKLSWAPYSVDITDAVVEGENVLTLRLTNSLRNLLGPHHNVGGELYAVGPHSFKYESGWTDDYCFVRFGIEDAISIQSING